MKALNEWDSKQRLGDSLPRPAETLATSSAQAQEFAATVNGPIVAKASGVAHKTDAGLVRLGLGPTDVGDVWDDLAAAGDGTIGIGGIAAEIFSDVVAILAPPEDGEVAEAVSQLAGRRLLEGIRGGPPVDLAALGRIVEAVARLLCSDPAVAEIDCNPVMVRSGIPIVADALVVLNEQE
jgi:hypothetical protein